MKKMLLLTTAIFIVFHRIGIGHSVVTEIPISKYTHQIVYSKKYFFFLLPNFFISEQITHNMRICLEDNHHYSYTTSNFMMIQKFLCYNYK